MSEDRCHFCGEPLDPREIGTRWLVEAWITQVPEGETPEIVTDSPPQAYAHERCLASASRAPSER